MKRFAFFCAMILSFLLLIACEVNTGKETDYSVNLPDIGEKNAMPGFSFLCDEREQNGSYEELDNGPVGIKINVESGSFVDSFRIFSGYGGTEKTAIKFDVFKWSESYKKTVKSKALYSSEIPVYKDGGYLTAHIPLGAVGGGEYLFLFTDEGSHGISFLTVANGNFDGNVTADATYKNGETLNLTAKAYVTYQDYNQPKSPENTEKTAISKDKAHVILLLGQSNATGQTMTTFLRQTADPADYEKYKSGYDNVLIYYDVDGSSNTSKGEFVPVTVGQGNTAKKFGPEIGIADVLSEKYPGEKFYIIKASWSGAGLTKHFNQTAAEYKASMNVVKTGLSKMEDMGLEPEIFATVWMQGETDSWSLEESIDYADRQIDFIERVSKKFEKYVAANGFSFIDGGISDSNVWTYSGIINSKKQICDISDVNRYYIDTHELGCYTENNDTLHYDSQDMIKLGKLFGEAIAKIYKI